MKPVCPRCQSTAVYEMTDATSHPLVSETVLPAVLVPLSIGLCKSLNIHPVIGVVLGSVLATAIEQAIPHHTRPITHKHYRCDQCSHVYHAVNESRFYIPSI
ncbi:hypothetical protein [Psychrobacter jeotgali]|uniref:hypothetical protein n=1 Tax=Psychrobacter jeotgali TaxID=179010 RepID=UPI00191A4312|nr:hypothetical protein [Psychrobacter jeotgali]